MRRTFSNTLQSFSREQKIAVFHIITIHLLRLSWGLLCVLHIKVTSGSEYNWLRGEKKEQLWNVSISYIGLSCKTGMPESYLTRINEQNQLASGHIWVPTAHSACKARHTKPNKYILPRGTSWHSTEPPLLRCNTHKTCWRCSHSLTLPGLGMAHL